MSACPSTAILAQLATDELSDLSRAVVIAHIDRCPSCQAAVERLARNLSGPETSGRPGASTPELASSPFGYVIVEELGRGEMGVVYHALEEGTGRSVALKRFPSAGSTSAESRILQEGVMLSCVSHPNIVQLFAVLQRDGWDYLVMELVRGGSLKAHIEKGPPPRGAALLVETVARAVDAIHRAGFLHYDVKPSNILLVDPPDPSWEQVVPKLADFGIARFRDDPEATMTELAGPRGTPRYMAPEQVSGSRRAIGPPADVHGLGATLYQLLAGQAPFSGLTIDETLDQVRTKDPVPPRAIRPGVPRDLETICLKCLRKDPSRRYPTAQALADDLRRWLDGRPIVARRVSSLEHAWRFCLRRPAVAGLLAVLALTLATGVVGLFVLLKQAEAERTRLAEARRHALAYEQFSASAADELGTFLRTTIRLRRDATPEQMVASLLKLRSSTSDLRNRGIVPSSTLGILEEEIGSALMSFDRRDESGELMDHAIADLKRSVAVNPDRKEVRLYLGEALVTSGLLADEAGRFEAALNCFEQAGAVFMDLDPSPLISSLLTNLYKALQPLADRHDQSGRTGLEKRARRLSHRILQHLLGPDLARSRDIYILDIYNLNTLFSNNDFHKVSSDDDLEIRRSHERFVCDWLALSVRPLSPFRPSMSAADFDRDPARAAGALVVALRMRCSKLGLADSMVSATIGIVCEDAVRIAAAQRKLHKLDDAHATVARLMTIARRLVQEYPDGSHSYQILSEAYNQVKKNAFQNNDDKLVDESLVQAIEAAQRAVALEPTRNETRRQLEKLTEQLASIRADRSARGLPRFAEDEGQTLRPADVKARR